MQLHELQPTHPRRNPKVRVGRGGKRGTTSGRGTKGQKSRAGHRIRPAGRDLIQRLPKLRGYHNQSVTAKPHIVDIGRLEKLSTPVVTPEILKKAGFVRERKGRTIKLLGSATLSHSFIVRRVEVSKSARKSIEEAGGKVE